MSPASPGIVAFVELRVEGRPVGPFFSSVGGFWARAHPDDASLSSFSDSACTISSPLYGWLELAHQSFPIAPTHRLANGLSTSATPPPSTPTSLGNGRTPDWAGLSCNLQSIRDASQGSYTLRPTPTPLPAAVLGPRKTVSPGPPAYSYGELVATGRWTIIAVQVILVDSSTSKFIGVWPSSIAYLYLNPYTVSTPSATVATSTPPPPTFPASYPTPSVATGNPDKGPSWASQHAWILHWTLPFAVHLGIGIGLYLAHSQEVDLSGILKILRLHEELGDLPHILREHDISTSELRSHIKQNRAGLSRPGLEAR
ncbi:hypothetical protein FRC06_008674 [Ceratobasidium sp. 370]|nr:hypothetical protein FRC06_008674 [Ceratobasidium sp. 370]